MSAGANEVSISGVRDGKHVFSNPPSSTDKEFNGQGIMSIRPELQKELNNGLSEPALLWRLTTQLSLSVIVPE